MKLTPELIQNSVQTTNPLGDRELDLRGYKVALLENLSATLDQFDTIDLTDNEVRKLDGFPHLPRLSCLVLNNNKVMRIGDGLSTSLPRLSTLLLTNNCLQELADLEPLTALKQLRFLSLLKNPVCSRRNYRLHVVHKLPSLRYLDFRRVTDAERKQAAAAAAAAAAGDKSASSLKAPVAVGKTLTFTPGAPVPAAAAAAAAAAAPASGGGPTSADLLAVREAIRRANTLDEVDRLNRLLTTGNYAGFAKSNADKS